MQTQTITLNGDAYVIVPKREWDELQTLANMPPLPPPNADGTFPAVAYARASIARDIIVERVRRGLSQAELARRAGVRVETLCRIERGQHAPTLATLEKLDQALQGAETAKRPRPRSG